MSTPTEQSSHDNLIDGVAEALAIEEIFQAGDFAPIRGILDNGYNDYTLGRFVYYREAIKATEKDILLFRLSLLEIFSRRLQWTEIVYTLAAVVACEEIMERITGSQPATTTDILGKFHDTLCNETMVGSFVMKTMLRGILRVGIPSDMKKDMFQQFQLEEEKEGEGWSADMNFWNRCIRSPYSVKHMSSILQESVKTKSTLTSGRRVTEPHH
jgi:hypothetical protein